MRARRSRALIVANPFLETELEKLQAAVSLGNLAEELSARITRDAYTRGAKGAHTLSSAAEVRKLKMWIDAVLGELLAIHK
jgi:hypothetical protein